MRLVHKPSTGFRRAGYAVIFTTTQFAKCPHCEHEHGPFNLTADFSYFGKCLGCGRKIAVLHPDKDTE